MDAVRMLRALLSNQIRLEFDVSKDKPEYQQEFKERYEELTGTKVRKGATGYNVVGKWGRQYRIYLSLDAARRDSLKKLGLNPTRNDLYQARGYNYRITDQEAFWGLIELGFRLGDNP